MSKRFIWAVAYGSSIGWGAFILPGDWLAQSGTLGAILGITIGGLLMLIIAVSYGALTAKFPMSGGEFAFSYVGFGKYFSFITSWFLVLGYIGIIALNASAFTLLFKFLFPNFFEVGYLYSVAGWDVYLGEVLLATFVLALFAYISTKGSGLSGKIQFVFCSFIALAVAGLLLSSFFTGDFALENTKPLFAEGNSWLTSILLIVAIAPFMYVGFDNIPQTAEEFNFSANKTFKLLVFSIVAAIFTYIAMILLTSWTFYDQQSIGGAQWITGSVVQNSMGVVGMSVLAFAISFGVFTGMNGFYLSSSRLLFALGRANFIPKSFSKVHPVNKTPYVAVLFVMVTCFAAPWLGRTALEWIVDTSSVSVSVAFFATSATAVKIFSKGKEKNKFFTSFGILGIAISIIFLALLLIPSSPAALTVPSYIVLAIWIILGAIFFATQFKKLKHLSKEELDYMILDEKPDDKKI